MNIVSTQEIVRVLEGLKLSTLEQDCQIYSEDALFSDPFNSISGIAEIVRLYRVLLEGVSEHSFKVTDHFEAEDHLILKWHFAFKGRGKWAMSSEMVGMSVLQRDSAGRILRHEDYWDSGKALFSRLPLFGWLYRVVAKRLRLNPPALGLRGADPLK